MPNLFADLPLNLREVDVRPRILGKWNDARFAWVVNRLLKEEARPVSGLFKVLLLSAPDSQDTLILANPISNDKRSKSGKPTAFTMGQRYVSSEALMLAKTTSDLN